VDKPTIVYLPKNLCREMLQYAREQLPLEACGILSADWEGRPLQFFPARNELQSSTRYNVHPEDLLRILTLLEENKQEIWGVFHSHPESEAYPSKIDLDMAYYPQAYHLIASFKVPQHPVLRGFVISEGKVKEIILILAE